MLGEMSDMRLEKIGRKRCFKFELLYGIGEIYTGDRGERLDWFLTLRRCMLINWWVCLSKLFFNR